jgi:hypothetical protein
MSATKAKEPASKTFAEVFHDAMRNYEEALKSGIKLQEESMNLWKDLLTEHERENHSFVEGSRGSFRPRNNYFSQ